MTLKTRFSLTLIANTMLVLALFGAAYYVLEKRSTLQAQAEEQLKMLDKVSSVCRAMFLNTNAIIALDFIHAVKKEPAVVSASCVDANGRVLAHSDPKELGRIHDDPDIQQRISELKPWSHSEDVPEVGRVIEWHSPVMIGSRVAGLAMVGYNQEILEQNLRGRLISTLKQLLIVAGCTFLFSILIGLALSANLSRPIRKLVDATRAIGAGDLNFESPIVERSDELGILAKEMNAMAQKLKELDELKDQFISNVSHDLRNPMAAIGMYVEYMLHGAADSAQLSKQQQDMLNVIAFNATRLNVFVSNILDAAKMKAGKMEYRMQQVDVMPILKNIAGLYAIAAAQQNLALSIVSPTSLPAVFADPERLEHVFSNLVSNALKFTRPGGRIEIEARPLGNALEISVADTGVGIAKEDLPKLFARFKQFEVGAQRANNVRGTGLGLSIVKETVEAMRGAVKVESEKGKGTRITLQFALAPARLTERRGDAA